MLLILALLTADAMPLDEAVAGALETSAVSLLSAARVAEATARLDQATAAMGPTASLSAGAVLQNEVLFDLSEQLPLDDIPLFDPESMEPVVVQPGAQLTAGVSVTQPVVVPAAWAARRVGREGVALAELQADADAAQVVALAVGAWHASAQAHALVVQAREGVELAERLQERAEAMVEHGVAARDQVLPFRQALASARASLALAESAAVTADGVLGEVTGLSGAADAPELPSELPSVEACLGRIDRPDLRAAAQAVVTAEAAVGLSRSARLPVVAVQGGVTALTPEPGFGDAVNWRVAAGVSVPLVGGGVGARIDESAARLAQARAARELLRDRAELEVRGAHGGLAAAMASLEEHEEAVRLAHEAVEAAAARLDGGAGSLLALQQAQAALIGAKARRTSARSAAARAHDELELAIRGEL